MNQTPSKNDSEKIYNEGLFFLVTDSHYKSLQASPGKKFLRRQKSFVRLVQKRSFFLHTSAASKLEQNLKFFYFLARYV